MEVSAELREEIPKLNERIKELEDELANVPEPKDDASSSSDSYKEDLSGELEELKAKLAKFESFKRTIDSEVEELNITISNLEKRNIELKLLLRRNNIDLEGSPMKQQDTTEERKTENWNVTTDERKDTKENKKDTPEKKKDRKTKWKDDDSEEKNDKDKKKDKGKKKDKKKDKKKRSSSSSSSNSNTSKRSDILEATLAENAKLKTSL